VVVWVIIDLATCGGRKNLSESTIVDRAVAAIQGDADLRYYLGMRCGYHPDMLAMSVAGYTVGEVTARYRETLARVVREEGIEAVDTSVAHLVREGGSVRFIEDAFDFRPMFHGVQVAARATVTAAAEERQLEARILAEIAACLLSEAEDSSPSPTNDVFDEWVRGRVQRSERCTGVVSHLAIEFARTVAGDAVRRANLASASLVDLERMLRLRPLGPEGVRLPAHVRPLPVIAVFRDGVARVPVNHAVWALQNAIRDAVLGVGWTDAPDRLTPVHVTTTNSGRGSVSVSFGEGGAPVSAPGALGDIWEKVQALDDLTADALLVCLAHWVAAEGDPEASVWVSADAILDARGIQRMRRRDEPGDWQHGHRREDRLAAGRALAQLDNLWLEIVDVEVVPGKGERQPRRLRAESRALAILDRVSERGPDGEEVFLAARVVPGEWARSLWELGLRQTGLLAQQALAYDPYRERPERWLARYLALAFRWNASRRAARLRLRVATLLENAALTTDPARPQRGRDRLERALDRLVADAVIGDWRYEADPGALPARHWLQAWTAMLIQIDPPDVVRRRYAGIGRGVRAGT
jgi:hypothetical protein